MCFAFLRVTFIAILISVLFCDAMVGDGKVTTKHECIRVSGPNSIYYSKFLQSGAFRLYFSRRQLVRNAKAFQDLFQKFGPFWHSALTLPANLFWYPRSIKYEDKLDVEGQESTYTIE